METATAFSMLLPDLIGLFAFVFLPMLVALYTSLQRWDGMTDMQFVGLGNYAKLARDETFWRSLLITVGYTLIYVPSVFVFSLLLALLVNSMKGKARSFFQTAFFFPYAISVVVASLVWAFLYDPMRGYLNAFLGLLGIEPQRWLASTTQALPSVAAVGIWLALGFNMVVYLAAIRDVPRSYYEAAEMDGAGSVRSFFAITLPLLKNTNVFVLVVTTIGSFQVFDQIKVMTNGGPASATNVTVYYIFRQAFEVSNLGYSSAVAFALFLVIVVLTFAQMKLMPSEADA